MVQTMGRTVSWLYQSIVQLIAPSFCVHCQTMLEPQEFLCSPCVQLMRPLVTTNLVVTEKYSAKLYAISSYDGPLRSLISAKYHNNRLASKQLGQLIWHKTDLRHAAFDIIVPVPLHWTRFSWRWFNQAAVIAQEISKASGKPIVNLLARTSYTPYQKRLSRARRLTNVKGVFALCADAHRYQHKKILIVDDVVTTGTTLKECAKQLLVLKPESLLVGVGCRTV